MNELKELGNEAIKNQKYELAVLHYTHAIKLDPRNYTLHSNRSFAFLKMGQYYHSLQDAKETINLNPNWAKVTLHSQFVAHNNKRICRVIFEKEKLNWPHIISLMLVFLMNVLCNCNLMMLLSYRRSQKLIMKEGKI